MNKQPSLARIITIDYAAFTAVLFPIVVWAIYIVEVVLQRLNTTDIVFPAVNALITLIAIGIFLWRVRLFYSIFSDGQEVSASISNVSFFRDRGRVDYIYTYQG